MEPDNNTVGRDAAEEMETEDIPADAGWTDEEESDPETYGNPDGEDDDSEVRAPRYVYPGRAEDYDEEISDGEFPATKEGKPRKWTSRLRKLVLLLHRGSGRISGRAGRPAVLRLGKRRQ